MANIIYREPLQVLSPRAPFTKIIQTEAGQQAPLYISNLYFGVTSATGGILKRWDGGAWVTAKLQVYTGSFVTKILKVYKNNLWQTVTTL